MSKPKVLIASFLEPELVEQIARSVPDVELIYRPDLIGAPRYSADHSAAIERSAAQEAEWRTLLQEADILFDFDHSHRDDLPSLAPKLKWIQATSAGIGQFVKRMGYAEATDWIFTTASGVHSRPLAEFALMAMLMFHRNPGHWRSGRIYPSRRSRHHHRWRGRRLHSRSRYCRFRRHAGLKLLLQ
jgi:phosphoglycerate dehydrogenase-like enzyme